MYALNLFIEHLENTDENNIFFLRSPQEFWLSSAPGVLSTLVTSVVLYSLTRATLMSPWKDKTCVCGYIYIYIIYIYIYMYIYYILYYILHIIYIYIYIYIIYQQDFLYWGIVTLHLEQFLSPPKVISLSTK